MRPSSDPTALSEEHFARVWRTITVAAMLGASYYTLCISGMARVKFLTELGAEARHFGIMTAVGSVAIVFQILGGVLSNRLPSRKRTWIVLTITHRLVFLGVLAAPFLFGTSTGRLAWIIVMLFLHEALLHTGLPLWFPWIADIVPKRTFNRHWGARQRTITVASIAAQLVIVVIFGWFERQGQVIEGFLLIGCAGVVMGVVDILMFRGIPEPEPERQEGATFATILEPLRDPQFRPFLVFNGVFTFGAALLFPFFPIFILKKVGLEAWTTQILMIASAACIAMASKFWGLLCDTYGHRPVLRTVIVGKCFIPLALILSPPVAVAFGLPFGISVPVSLVLLTLAFGFDGVLNSALMLAQQSYVMQTTPRRNRGMYFVASAVFSAGIGMALAPLLGGWFIDHFDHLSWRVGVYDFGSYHLVFAASILLRVVASVVAGRLHDSKGISTPVMLSHLRETNPFHVLSDIRRLTSTQKPSVRAQAARRLGRVGSPLAIGELVRALRDPERAVRQAAIHALGRIGTTEATEHLAGILADTSSDLQSSAARALGRIGGFDSLHALLDHLQKADRKTVERTVEALMKIGDSAALLPLICLFHDVEDEKLRAKITVALAALSETESPEAILTALTPRGRPAAQP